MATLGTLLLLAAYGLPWVVVTRSLAWNARAAAVALLGGVVDLGLLTLVLMQFGMVNPTTVLLGAGIALALTEGLRRSASRGAGDGAAPEQVPSRDGWIELALVAVLVAIALWARRQPVNFVFQTGDMGEYVNNANLVARGERLGPSFPHLFATLLSAPRVLFGFAYTTVLVPALSSASLVVAVALVRRWGGSMVVAALGGLVMAISPFGVWFGIFPVSETMMATLLLGTFYALVVAVRARSGSTAVPAAAFAGALLGTAAFVRGTGVVFALLPLLALPFLWDRRPRVRRCVAPFAVPASVLISASVLYNFSSSRPYMDLQVRNILGEDFPSIPMWLIVAATVAFVAGVVAVSMVGGRRDGAAGTHNGRAARWLPAAPGVGLAALVAVHLAAFENTGLVAAIDAFGWPILIASAIGLFALAVPRSWLAITPMVGVQMVGLAAIGSLLYAHRLPEPLSHSYYLYWERYSVSEILPVVVALAMAGLVLAEVAVLTLARRWAGTADPGTTDVGSTDAGTPDSTDRTNTGKVWARWVVGIGVALAAVATVAWSVPQIREINRLEFLGGTDEAIEQLAATAGDTPVVYAGRHPSPWFFPNTYRSFALPLEQSLGVSVLNIDGLSPFGSDPSPSLGESADLARSEELEEVVVVSVGPAATTDPLRRECQTDPDCEWTEAIDLPVSWRINNARDLDPWLTSNLRFNTFVLDTGS